MTGRQPEAREPVGCAELEVGRAVYERIEKLIDATTGPEGEELSYLAHLVASVEEVGGYDGPPPPSREEAIRAAVAEIKALECGGPAPSADKLRIAVEALEPFDRVAQALSSKWADHETHWDGCVRHGLTVGDLRQAATALAALKAEGA